METSSAYFRLAPAHSPLISHPGVPLRVVSENKRICTKSCCSYSNTPQRVWVSRTKTCEPPSFPASMLRPPAAWTRFVPSPRSSITSATGNTDNIYTAINSSALVVVDPHKYVPSNADSVLYKYVAEFHNTSEKRPSSLPISSSSPTMLTTTCDAPPKASASPRFVFLFFCCRLLLISAF